MKFGKYSPLTIALLAAMGWLIGAARTQAQIIIPWPPVLSHDYNGFKWVTADNQSISIIGYDGPGGAVSIPDAIPANSTTNAASLPVTDIAFAAFENCSNLTSIDTGNNVTNIAGAAFNNCKALTNVIFGNQLASIGQNAFSGCAAANVLFPNSVTSIGAYAFANCAQIASVTFGTDPLSRTNLVTAIGGYAFENCTNLTQVILGSNVTGQGSPVFEGFLVGYDNPGAALRQLSILNGVSCIGNGTFAGCTGLTNIVIPDSLINLGNVTNELAYGQDTGVFSGCTNLTQVTFGANVANIGISAFEGCAALPKILVPDHVADLADYAFASCSGLTNFTVPPAVTNIGTGAFEDCAGLASLAIGPGVLSIGDQAFAQCSGLKIANIPDNVVSIGNSAFAACYGLTKVTIGKNVANIGAMAFSFSASIPFFPQPPPIIISPLISRPNAVAKAAASPIPLPFYDAALTNITVAPANRWYGSLNGALFNKQRSVLIQVPDGLKGAYEIPETVSTVETNAFLHCEYLTNIAIPAGVDHLGDNAFSSCSSLTELSVAPQNRFYASQDGVLFNKQLTTVLQYPQARRGIYALPKNTIEIGNSAFGNCPYLTGLSLPASLKRIDESAFQYCSALTNLAIPNSVTAIGDQAFIGCSRLAAFTLPDGLTEIGNSEFTFCRSLTQILIPPGVTNIGAEAFLGCASLNQINLPAGINNLANDLFFGCASLATVRIPAGVTNIGWYAFANCTSLLNIIIPASVTNLEYYSFEGCTNLTEVFFGGNSPGIVYDWTGTNGLFAGDNLTVYYLPGTTGWSANFAGAPAVMGNPLLTLLTNGLGSIEPADNGALLPLGDNFTLTASPHRGFKFLNWTGGTNQPLTTLTNGPTLQFVMQLNEVLQANFVETSRPTLYVFTPPSHGPGEIQITGAASDDWQVTGVWCRVNQGPWQLAHSTDHWLRWNLTLPLAAGLNTIQTYALNMGGNPSFTNSVAILGPNSGKLKLQLASPRPPLASGLMLTLEKTSDLAGHIEYSTNLVNWVHWKDFTGGSSKISFQDFAATNSVQRFYRVVVP